MQKLLSIDFIVHQYTIFNGKIKVDGKKQKILTFTIEGSEIRQSRQLDVSSMYLFKTTITTTEQLCAVQVVLLYKKLGKIAQNVRFQISQFEDIIKFRYSNFWDNIGLVAAQMGLDVLSVQSACESYCTQFAKSIENHDLQYFSLYNSFDTKKILQPKNISYFSFHENQVLLQLAAIKYQKEENYPLILPLILGYSAFRLYETKFNTKYKENDQQIENLKLLKDTFDASNKTYSDAKLLTNGNLKLNTFPIINLFELPIHFNETSICLLIFQQLFHVSYLFKAEYFALFSLVKNKLGDTITNAVISQSSRSGKSVALYTQYFFHLLIGNIPILFNKEGSEDQPLYYYKSGSFHSQLERQYQNTLELQDFENLRETVLYDVCIFHAFQLESLNHLEYLYRKMHIFIENLQSSTRTINGVGGLDLIKNLRFDSSIKQQFDLLKQYSFFIYEGDVDTSGIMDAQVLQYSLKRMNNQRPIMLVDECLDSQKQNYQKCIALCEVIFGESLQRFVPLGRQQYGTVLNILKNEQFESFPNEYTARYNTTHIFACRVLSQLLHPDLLSVLKMELDEISASEQHRSLNLDCYHKLQIIMTNILSLRNNKQVAETEINKQICENWYLLTIYFSLLEAIMTDVEYIIMATEYLRLQTEEYDILDELMVYSPQILNVRSRKKFKNKFFLGLPKNCLSQQKYKEEFDLYFFRFIVSLFDPRAVETLFWKTFQFISFEHIYIEQKSELRRDSKYWYQVVAKFWIYSVNDQFASYFNFKTLPIRFEDQLQSIITKSSRQLENLIHTTHAKVHESYHACTFSVIIVGPDIDIINESSIDKFSYETCERDYSYHYAASIIGYVQPHPSLVHSAQYDKRSMLANQDDMGGILDGIPKTLKSYLDSSSSLVELLNSMLGESSARMQLICPFICHQLWYVDTKYQPQACNFNAVEKHTIQVNGNKSIVYQFSSLTKIVNYIDISTICNRDSGFKINSQSQNINLQENDRRYNLRCIASATLNQEVVAVLSYSLMCQFIQTYSMVQLTTMDAQREFCSLSGYSSGAAQQIISISSCS
ncbi:hypothetical protein SS50377_25233 [Spironucleus salmonicida]|uniref:Uncharacterized protein n=1 Tax=Spironucleus salmonicida TaxID=348837 RepID=A0A9P8LRQ0_9EUKA|nr:hypothetical protein SS50377_25233 [Spironucleus salmonicida]